MKHFYDLLKKYLYNHDIDIETRLGTAFMTISMITSLLGIFVCIGARVPLKGIATVAVVFALIPISMLLSYKTGRKNAPRIIMTIGVEILMPVIWYTCGGLLSGCNVWFAYEIFFISLALKGIPLIVAISSAVLLDGSCYIVSVFHPELVYSLESQTSIYVSTIGSVLIVSAMITLTVLIQKKIYNHECEQLLRTQRNLENASHIQKAFLRNMSHEIRTPINGIIGMNEMILRENNVEEMRKFAADIQNSSQTLLSIVNDMLDFTRIESGNMEIVCDEYLLNDVIKASYNLFQMRANDKEIDFFVRNNPKLPKMLYGDEHRIHQIITNLLSNALKYTEKGYMMLTLDMEHGESDEITLIITVSDTGRGISREDLEKLFHSFERLDISRELSVQGAGLGLAITKNLVEMMKGTISVESTLNKGSIFTVRIPQKIVDHTPIGIFRRDAVVSTHPYEDTFHAPDARVLVVDDIELNLKVISGLLKKTQVSVDTALSAADAIEMCRKTKYQLIFMDHMMPEMDGIEAFHIIRDGVDLNHDTPIVMLTANAVAGVKNDYLREGFSDYISKPVKPDLLERVLRKFVSA